jgi:hypothetical protein
MAFLLVSTRIMFHSATECSIERNSHSIVARLKREGFKLVSIKGSRTIIVPHPKKDLPTGTALALPSVFSAADEEDDLTANAIEALRLWAEDETLPTPSSYEEISSLPEVREHLSAGAFLTRVPFIEDTTRTVRANVTFDKGMLDAIDAAAKERGLARSAFLASAARKEIEAA